MSTLNQRIHDAFASIAADKLAGKERAKQSKVRATRLKADMQQFLAEYRGNDKTPIQAAMEEFKQSRSTIYRYGETSEQKAARLAQQRAAYAEKTAVDVSRNGSLTHEKVEGPRWELVDKVVDMFEGLTDAERFAASDKIRTLIKQTGGVT